MVSYSTRFSWRSFSLSLFNVTYFIMSKSWVCSVKICGKWQPSFWSFHFLMSKFLEYFTFTFQSPSLGCVAKFCENSGGNLATLELSGDDWPPTLCSPLLRRNVTSGIEKVQYFITSLYCCRLFKTFTFFIVTSTNKPLYLRIGFLGFCILGMTLDWHQYEQKILLLHL